MRAKLYLKKYAEGWSKGDLETLLRAVADDYILDDPNYGKVSKSGLSKYLAEFEDVVASLRGDEDPGQLMEFSEVLTQEADGVLTASCWWAVPGADIQGSGLIKIDASGVRSEVLTYYTKLNG